MNNDNPLTSADVTYAIANQQKIAGIVSQLKEGVVVEIIDDFLHSCLGRSNVVFTTANVTHLTKTQCVVRTASGHEMRYRLKDLRITGYHQIHYAYSLRLGQPVQ